MPKQLPAQPNINVLRKQTRQLLRAYQAGDAEAIALVQAALRDLPPSASAEFSLRHAHQVVARDYGFTSWQALADHIAPKSKPLFSELPPHYEELVANLVDAVLAGEEGRFGLLGSRLKEELTAESSRAQALAEARLVLARESGCGSTQEFCDAVESTEIIVSDAGQLRQLEEFHTAFTTHLAAALGVGNQTAPSVNVAFTDQTTFGEYLLSIANANVVFQMSATFLQGDFAVNVPRHLLDGLPLAQTSEETPATALWAKLLSEALAKVWEGRHRGEVTVRECYQEPYGGLRFAPMYEVSLLFAYQVSSGSGEASLEGIVEVCYPRTSVIDIVGEFTSEE